MPTVRKKTALLDGLDQYSAYYSVICVFGSVVGCVVVPLITQSIESIIFSAILISLTAKTIHSRSSTLKEESQDDRKRGTRDGILHDKRTKRKKLQSISKIIDTDMIRRQRQEELLRIQEQRAIEKEQKLEEKKLKKARKREQKLKIKEEEEREKAREAQLKKEREERKVQQKLKKYVHGFGSLESIEPLTRQQPVKRERKNSSSSSSSTRSCRSPAWSHPSQVIPRVSRAASDSNLPFPSPSLSPIPAIPTSVKSKQNGSTWEVKMNRATLTHLTPSHPPNHSTNNNHSSPGQVYAVNPLAPSSSVTMATNVTSNDTRQCSWNEQLYYWSLDQAGLTQPLQYGWDPVISSNYSLSPTTGNSLHLQVPHNVPSWGSGPSSAPGKCPNPPVTASPLPSSAPPTCPQPESRVATELKSLGNEHPMTQADKSGEYSLFNSSGKSLFDGYFEGGPCSGSSSTWFNEGASPSDHKDEEEKFDEWPAL